MGQSTGIGRAGHLCSRGRKFALIHFSGKDEVRTDRFLPGNSPQRNFSRPQSISFDGGTDFETPLHEALRLMDEEAF